MSDNIPFDIQLEIIKKVSNVKSLIQFRSVSKQWKLFIDSTQFINGYGARLTEPHSFILSYKVRYGDDAKFIRLVEDNNNETFKVQEQELAPVVVSSLLKQYHVRDIVGACHGLLCLLCHTYRKMVVIWNPSIRKSFGIADPDNWWDHIYGFGVCPNTSDPTVVKIIQEYGKPWHVEVFTLSSGVWNVIPSSNLLRQSIKLTSSRQVVIDRLIYWAAYDHAYDHAYDKCMVVSFDLIIKEFKVIDLPDNLTNELCSCCSVSKLRESLVVYRSKVGGAGGCDVWVMEHDSSFIKLFSINAWVDKILGFRVSGEPIFTTLDRPSFTKLDVYNPWSQQINTLGIYGAKDTFFMGSYEESLLLLDHSDLHIYCEYLYYYKGKRHIT